MDGASHEMFKFVDADSLEPMVIKHVVTMESVSNMSKAPMCDSHI